MKVQQGEAEKSDRVSKVRGDEGDLSENSGGGKKELGGKEREGKENLNREEEKKVGKGKVKLEINLISPKRKMSKRFPGKQKKRGLVQSGRENDDPERRKKKEKGGRDLGGASEEGTMQTSPASRLER